MKKIFKNSFMALAVLALGFSACTEVEYTPAEVPSNNQVFFPNTNAKQIDIKKEATSFDIVVSRVVKGEAAIVPVTVVADDLGVATFDFPAAVEFADTMSTAIYTVTVKEGAGLDYTQYAEVAITLSSEFTTPYGDATYSFKVGVPAPWSEWKKVKTATYNYTGSYWSGAFEGVTVRYRESLINDVEGQFGVTYIEQNEKGEDVEYGLAGGFEFLIDYNRKTGECQVPVQQVTVNSNYGPVFVCDPPHYPLQAGLTYEKFPCTYDAEKGLFSLNVVYFVCSDLGSSANGMFGNGVETIQLDGFKAYDYSFSMEHRGNFVDNNGVNNAVISTTKGADVPEFLMTVISADEDADAAVQGMLAGTVACDTLTEAGFYAYPITESGNYMALAITFDAEGEPLKAYSTEFEFWVAGDSNPWESIGYAVYTDDIILPGFGNSPMSYYVEVLENQDQPGLFRMVDPYGPEFPLYPYASSYEEGSYIEIDATDPEGVWIEGWQSTGLDVQNNGLMEVTSMAWYQANKQGATKEDAKEAGLCGVYADGVITFPVDGMLFAIGDKAYYGNRNGAFALDMTNLLESIPAEAAASRSIAARMMMEIKAETMGKVTRFKKIDNSFLTLKDCEIE